MGLRVILFIGAFGIGSLWALSLPFAGIVTYVIYYNSAPEMSWWGSPLSASGVRYGVVISLALTAGTLLNLGRLPYRRLLDGQEWLYLTFLTWMFVLSLVFPMQSAEFKGTALYVTVPVEKMLKITPFVLALSHVVITPRRVNQYMWLLVICGLYVGYECLNTPVSHYVNGRLEGVGPVDARDSNMLAAHLAVFLPIIGVRYLVGSWRAKLLCVVAAGLVANGIVLTKSRGGYMSILAGVISGLILIPKGYRKRVVPLVLLGVVGAAAIVDQGFIDRMSTLEAGERDNDESAQSRLRVWGAGLKMSAANPLGVGPGNFHSSVGDYLPEDSGRDPHNTYVRCLAELGAPGMLLFVAMIGNAFLILGRIRRLARARPELEGLALNGYGVQVALIAYLVASFFITTLYLESIWWLLLLPSAMERAASNPEAASADLAVLGASPSARAHG
jgi:hypothetical protein